MTQLQKLCNIFLAFLIAGLVILSAGKSFSATADVTLPAAVTFNVTNVNVITVGSPDPIAVSYSNELPGGDDVWFAIKANAANFTRPGAGGDEIPASSVSWTTANQTNGVGVNGTLSTSWWNVYESDAMHTSGSANVTFRLAAPGTSVRAGTHTLECTWKVFTL